jgi:hypothetical protein
LFCFFFLADQFVFLISKDGPRDPTRSEAMVLLCCNSYSRKNYTSHLIQ